MSEQSGVITAGSSFVVVIIAYCLEVVKVEIFTDLSYHYDDHSNHCQQTEV